jgi:DNA-binding NarL/FixJ family response regulator
VLLDLSMPRLSGEETLVEIRKLRPEARILLTSGFSEQEAMHRIARRRGVSFIQKPYRLEELVERLTQVLAS